MSAQTSSAVVRFGLLVFLLVMLGTANGQNVSLFTLTDGTANYLTTDAGACGNGYAHCYTLTIPSVDALGLTPPAGAGFQTFSDLPNGFVFAATLLMSVRVGPNYTNDQAVTVSADVNAPGRDFARPSLLRARACTTGCGTAAGFAPDISTAPTIRYSGIEGPNIPLYAAVYVPVYNGPQSFAGPDSAIVTLRADAGNKTSAIRLTIRVNTISTAIWFKTSFGLGTTTDFAVDFGNVNGLGLGGVTAPAPAPNAPGVVYYQPYTITPMFSNFNPGGANPTISAYVSTNFAPANAGQTLVLCDATASMAACTPLPISPQPAAVLFSNLVGGSTYSRALGLIVKEVNGASAFPGGGSGATSAIVTYVMTPQ